MDWKLAEAKNKLSEVVNRALANEPQVIHRRNDAVVVISKETFDRLSGETLNFRDFLLTAPEALGDLDLARDKSLGRDIDFSSDEK